MPGKGLPAHRLRYLGSGKISSDADGIGAVETIDSLFQGSPFDTPASRANLFALPLSFPIVDGQEAKPSERNIFGDGRAQSAEGGDVVQRAYEERPHHHLRVYRRPAKVGAVPLFQGRDKLGEVQLLVGLNEQMVGIDEVPQLLGGELEQC